MKWSAEDVAEVPLVLVTVTSLAPAVPAGAVAVIEVADLTVKLEAAVAPKSTAVTAVKPVPVMVTAVPPASGPAAGLTLVTVGVTTAGL